MKFLAISKVLFILGIIAAVENSKEPNENDKKNVLTSKGQNIKNKGNVTTSKEQNKKEKESIATFKEQPKKDRENPLVLKERNKNTKEVAAISKESPDNNKENCSTRGKKGKENMTTSKERPRKDISAKSSKKSIDPKRFRSLDDADTKFITKPISKKIPKPLADSSNSNETVIKSTNATTVPGKKNDLKHASSHHSKKPVDSKKIKNAEKSLRFSPPLRIPRSGSPSKLKPSRAGNISNSGSQSLALPNVPEIKISSNSKSRRGKSLSFESLAKEKFTRDKTYSLTRVMMVLRHGARTPINYVDFFAKPDDLPKLYDNVEIGGSLTKKGRQGMIELGSRLRSMYHDRFLDPHCTDDPDLDIEPTATSVLRSVKSAKAVIKGLYDPHGRLISGVTENHCDPGNLPDCERYEHEKAINIENNGYVHDAEVLEFFLKNLPDKTADDINASTIWDIVDNVLCEAAAGFKHPNWMDFGMLKTWKAREQAIATMSPVATRLAVGPMFKYILEDFIGKATSGSTCSKMQIFGSHDDSIQSLIHGLNVEREDDQLFDTDFGCGLIFELYSYQDNKNAKKKYFVKVLLNKNTKMELQTLVLKGCEELCPLKKFSKLLRKNIPKDWNKECKMTETEEKPVDNFGSASEISLVANEDKQVS